MVFNIEICRGNILDIINLADKNNLLIESIEQGPINDDFMSIKVKFSKNSSIHNLDKFVNDIRQLNNLNSCDIIKTMQNA